MKVCAFSLHSLLPGEAQSGDGSGLGISVALFSKQTKHLTVSWKCDTLPKSDCAFILVLQVNFSVQLFCYLRFKIDTVIVKIDSLVEQGDEGPRGMSPKEQQFLSTGVFSPCVIVHSTKCLP